MLACRMWWAMNYWGFQNVKVLNGGWKRWQQLKLPISGLAGSKVSEASNDRFIVSEKPNFKILFDQFLEMKDSAFLIDARGSDNYNGEPNDASTGHIPGSINLPFRTFLDHNTGLFKSKAEIEAMFYKCDAEFKNKLIIVSCGAGYAATVVFLALKMIGINSQLFDDSFSVWKTKPNLPIEQG